MPAVPRTIVFEDIDGERVEKEYYFQLGVSDLIDLDFVHQDNVAEYLNQLAQSGDTIRMRDIWKAILFKAVGVREGKRIVKSQDVLDEFVQSGAYEQLFVDLLMDNDDVAGAKFFTSIMPEDPNAGRRNAQKNEYSDQELLDMDDDSFYRAAGGSDIRNMNQRFMMLATRRKSNARLSA